MKSDKAVNDHGSVQSQLDRVSGSRRPSIAGYVLLLLLYTAAYVSTARTSRNPAVVMLFNHPTPIASFTGVFSTLGNFCLIFLVVFYGNLGFFTSLGLLVVQLALLAMQVFRVQNMRAAPGMFSSLFTMLVVVLLHSNNVKAMKYQERLRQQAVMDLLTGLPNRFACSELINSLVERRERFAVVSVDLNHFKAINNTMGRATGNKVLVEIARRLERAVNSGESGTRDFIACQGGVEFALLIRGYPSDEAVRKSIEYYDAVLEEKLTLEGCDYYITARYGYAEYPIDASNGDTLLTYAFTALYEAKRTGDHISRFVPDMLQIEQTLEIERKIRQALDDNTLCFYLQPQFDISHRLRGFEALARLKDDDGSFISPARFIPVAEKTGLIDSIDRRVFRDSALFLGNLIKRTGTDLTLSVNVSARHLMRNDFLDEVRSIVTTCDFPIRDLEIEITESIMINSAEEALNCINEIKRMGAKIALDDFGTGYSSLSYLNTFPADILKVDKSFIDKMNTSDSSKQYVAAIISIGHIMNFDVISEGVEEPEQLDTLRCIGCDYIQGFIWGRPLPPEEAEALVLKSVAA